jgi:UDP-glucose 4-epimerase
MNLSVIAGAASIAPHMIKHLRAAGHRVTRADNSSTGQRNALVIEKLGKLDIADQFLSRTMALGWGIWKQRWHLRWNYSN